MSEASDRQALTDVMASYGAAIDDKDYAALRALFEPDVEVTGFSPEPVHGVDAWVDFVHDMIERFRATQHMFGPTLGRVDGDAAEARTELRANHWYPEKKDGCLVVWGSYRTGLVRAPDSPLGWRIARHGFVMWSSEVQR